MAYVLGRRKPNLTFPTLTGSIVTFNSQYALPLKSHKIALTATQSGSGTPSPDNVRTINGYSAINVYHPDNIIDFSQCEKGYISYTGVMTNPTNKMEWTSGKIAVTPDSNIVWWADIVASDDQWVAFSYYDSSDNFIRRDSWNYTTEIYTRTVTVPSNATSVRMSWRNYSNDDFTNRYLFTALQGLTTITIGSTVYGGEYDARTGVLTVDVKGIKLVDVPRNEWQVGTKSVCYRVTLTDISTTVSTGSRHGALSNMATEYPAYFGVSRPNEADFNGFAITTGGGILALYDTDLTLTEADFLTKYADIMFVYPLATPQTIQLPPCPIDTLEGVNNIWADTGDTTLQYPKFG